jgi:hypothetical protein
LLPPSSVPVELSECTNVLRIHMFVCLRLICTGAGQEIGGHLVSSLIYSACALGGAMFQGLVCWVACVPRSY